VATLDFAYAVLRGGQPVALPALAIAPKKK
jgi:hypothetical protein